MSAPQHMATGFKHPDNMNRKDKLNHIKYLKNSDQETEAYKFYLRHCAGISLKSFSAA